MKYNIYINQEKCIEWGLNLQQGAILSLFTTLSSWAEGKEIDGKIFYYISVQKIITEVPIITTDKGTILRHIRVLKDKGLIDHIIIYNKGFYSLSDIGKEYIFDKDIKVSSVSKMKHKCVKNETPSVSKMKHNNNTSNNNTNNNNISKDILLEQKTFFDLLKETLEDHEFIENIKIKFECESTEIKSSAENFLIYWTEKNQNGKKELWQMQKTFDIKRRFYTRLSNNKKWKSNNNSKKITYG